MRQKFARATAVVIFLLFGLTPIATQATTPPNTWTPTGSMATARVGLTSTLLSNGNVLVTGGGTTSAELYNPHSGVWTLTGSLSVARSGATATLLTGGRVLVVGGCCASTGLGYASAELYDPTSGTWSPTRHLALPRVGHTATLLANGQVLVAGGACEIACYSATFFNNLASAELYDPTTGIWSITGVMTTYREYHTATLLPNGKVLVAGGLYGCDDSLCTDVPNADLYDPSTGTWTATGAMSVPRERQTATLLPNGKVLVAGGLEEGGFGSGWKFYASAELFDPTSGAWTSTGSMAASRFNQTATLLPDSQVLVAGGKTASAELYQPSKGIWVATGAMSQVRTAQAATLLPNGNVLVAGGDDSGGIATASAELFQFGAGPLVTLAPLALTFDSQLVGTASSTKSFKVTNNGLANLVVSGLAIEGANGADFSATNGCATLSLPPGVSCLVSVSFAPTGTGPRSATIAVVDNAPLSPQGVSLTGYGAGPNAWAPTGSLSSPRDLHTATLLANGSVLVAGGENITSYNLATAEIYDPVSRAWSATGSLNTGRLNATSTLLPGGDVLIAGGEGTNFVTLSSAELFHLATGTWTFTGSMQTARYGHTATLLTNGKVLVAGGGNTPTTELYDPSTNSWSPTGSMTIARTFASATLLTNGMVLVVGGDLNGTAEIYNPVSESWTPTGAMHVPRSGNTTTLLPSGRVLVTGGNPPACCGSPTATSEIYDPNTGVWSMGRAMSVGRYHHTATLLASGLVLVAGGCTGPCNPNTLATSELYNPGIGSWSPTTSMTVPRLSQTATLLTNGDVLAAGGSVSGCCSYTKSADLYGAASFEVLPGG